MGPQREPSAAISKDHSSRPSVLPGDDRANVLFAAALMLAALVVLGALALTLAPTGSDGTTGQSPSSEDVDTLAEGLEPIFVESSDLFTEDVDPVVFAGERPPIDPETAADLLTTEPFTDRQIAETVDFLLSLASQDTPAGSIASLEPADETETGTLIRLGNDDAHDFAGEESTLVEDAEELRDVVLVLEPDTLPYETEGAFELTVGEWTLQAFQDNASAGFYYAIDGYNDGQSVPSTADELRVDFTENEINGEPISENEALDIDPDSFEFDISISDIPWENGAGGTHGALTLVTRGGEPVDVEPSNTRDVVTRAVFEATYIDDATTYTDRVAVPAVYTAVDTDPSERVRPEVPELSLEIETEDPNQLWGVSEGATVWLPQYTQQNSAYDMTVEGTFTNGSTIDMSDDAEFSFVVDGEECTDDCARTLDHPFSENRVYGIPEMLTDELLIRATVTEGESFVEETVTVVDPVAELDVTITETETNSEGQHLLPMFKETEYALAAEIRYIKYGDSTTVVTDTQATHWDSLGGADQIDESVLQEGQLVLEEGAESEEELDIEATYTGYEFNTYDGTTSALTVGIAELDLAYDVEQAVGAPLYEEIFGSAGFETDPLPVTPEPLDVPVRATALTTTGDELSLSTDDLELALTEPDIEYDSGFHDITYEPSDFAELDTAGEPAVVTPIRDSWSGTELNIAADTPVDVVLEGSIDVGGETVTATAEAPAFEFGPGGGTIDTEDDYLAVDQTTNMINAGLTYVLETNEEEYSFYTSVRDEAVVRGGGGRLYVDPVNMEVTLTMESTVSRLNYGVAIDEQEVFNVTGGQATPTNTIFVEEEDDDDGGGATPPSTGEAELTLASPNQGTNYFAPSSSYGPHPTSSISFTSLLVSVEAGETAIVEVSNNIDAVDAYERNEKALQSGWSYRPDEEECLDAVDELCHAGPNTMMDFIHGGSSTNYNTRGYDSSILSSSGGGSSVSVTGEHIETRSYTSVTVSTSSITGPEAGFSVAVEGSQGGTPGT